MRAGILLGIGMGGFIDGILFHQILQWHHMLSSAGYPPDSVTNLQINTLADGLFHAFTWIVTLLGIYLLWSTFRRGNRVWPSKLLLGGMLMGFGLFNLVEGIVDHQILGIHHVRSGPYQMIYDLAFLGLGAVLLFSGWLIFRGEKAVTA